MTSFTTCVAESMLNLAWCLLFTLLLDDGHIWSYMFLILLVRTWSDQVIFIVASKNLLTPSSLSMCGPAVIKCHVSLLLKHDSTLWELESARALVVVSNKTECDGCAINMLNIATLHTKYTTLLDERYELRYRSNLLDACTACRGL
jgi:hypothetical protein